MSSDRRHLRAVPDPDPRPEVPSLTPDQQRELARAKRAARVAGLIVPAALAVIGVAIQLVWLPRMPDPAAVHWGPAGEPDGFGPPWQNAVMLAVVNVVVLSLYFLQGLQRVQAKLKPATPTWSSAHRLLPAIVLGAVVLNQVLLTGTGWTQLDAADARETGPVGGVLIAGFAAGAAATVLAFFAQPKLQIDAPGAAPAPLELGETERAVWIREIRAPRGFVWFGIATVVVLGALSLSSFTVDAVAGWITLACLLLVTLAMSSCLRFRVRIDASGLEIRSWIGWPVLRVAAGEVRSVAVAQIDPLAEYGGWGWRFAPGRTGVVLRRGEGIVVTRCNGRILGVTVDDAEGGAAVLAAAAAAARDRQDGHVGHDEHVGHDGHDGGGA